MISVVIPAYNAEPFIGATLESVLAQTSGELEVIVVDDGSTDRTHDVVSSFSPRVNLVTGPRQGVSAARNTGVRRSIGSYIAFMDHDDLWEPGKIARQAAVLNADPHVALVFTQALVEKNGQLVEIFPQIPDLHEFMSAAHENLLHWNYVPMSSVMVRRSSLAGVGDGPFDPRFRFSEDWDLWLRIAASSGPGGLVFIPEPLTRYQIMQGRATERMADLRMEDIQIFDEQLAAHPELGRANPKRCRSTRYRLREQAGYWLLREGRLPEARRVLREAWRLRPLSTKPLKYLVASMVGVRPAAGGGG